MTVLESLSDSLNRAASEYNPADQVAPVCVLWTDEAKQWTPLIPRLRDLGLPILQIGDYDPSTRTGPAIWLRCMVARVLPDADWAADVNPILYLPGVSRAMLRAVESCPPNLQAIAELQCRGVFWSQASGRDWTIAAFLQSAQGGLGIDVASDNATKDAIARALHKLADEPIEGLRADAPLNADRFNALLAPDPARNLLLWLNDPDGRKVAVDASEWAAFRDVCVKQYGFDPDADGSLTAAEKLGGCDGAWQAVWNRFAEAPKRYPSIPDRLRQARPAAAGLLLVEECWPQDNEEKETKLRADLSGLLHKSAAEARSAINQLEKHHGKRRNWVWAQLGQAPLATALPALSKLAIFAQHPMTGSKPADLAQQWVDGLWQADAAVLEMLSGLDRADDIRAVQDAITAIYRPWLAESAEAFQRAVASHPIPMDNGVFSDEPPASGRCIVFADGLRYDVGQLLRKRLVDVGLQAKIDWRFCALPGVTPTAKPAVSPVSSGIRPGANFGTVAQSDGAKIAIDTLRRLLTARGFQILADSDTGDSKGAAWAESGSLDKYGHEQGWKIARRIDEEVRELAERIAGLLDAGWSEIVVVTDHGWLMLPGNLPKAELPEHLTECRKGRCARLKPGAKIAHQTVPWRWDADVSVAVAPGITCYIAGKEYEHGGLSVQECVVPILTVTSASTNKTAPVRISDIRWTGLRCRVTVQHAPGGAQVNLRTRSGDPSSSIAASSKEIVDGQASVAVPNDTLEGQAAIVVVESPIGEVLAQKSTIVGG